MKMKLIVSVFAAFAAFIQAVSAQGIRPMRVVPQATHVPEKQKTAAATDQGKSNAMDTFDTWLESGFRDTKEFALLTPDDWFYRPTRMFVVGNEVHYIFKPYWHPRGLTVTVIADGEGRMKSLTAFWLERNSSFVAERKDGAWCLHDQTGSCRFRADIDAWEKFFKEHITPVLISKGPAW